MPLSDAERAHQARVARYYRGAIVSPVVLEIERETLGGDYGGTSWSDRAEVEGLAARLGLGPGVRALELGAGAGWPGLHLVATTGCDVTLSEPLIEGLRAAARRAAADGIAGRAHPVVADGAALPFRAHRFDAVYHCDVLC